MNVCLFKLALRQTGDLSGVYTAFSPNRSYPMILKPLLLFSFEVTSPDIALQKALEMSKENSSRF